jgi:hypothetical protein
MVEITEVRGDFLAVVSVNGNDTITGWLNKSALADPPQTEVLASTRQPLPIDNGNTGNNNNGNNGQNNGGQNGDATCPNGQNGNGNNGQNGGNNNGQNGGGFNNGGLSPAEIWLRQQLQQKIQQGRQQQNQNNNQVKKFPNGNTGIYVPIKPNFNNQKSGAQQIGRDLKQLFGR